MKKISCKKRDIKYVKNKDKKYITNLELQLQIKEELLLQNIKLASLGELLQNITHQWRQPLATISAIGCSMDFKRNIGGLDDNEITRCLNGISNNVTNLTETINNFSTLFQNSNYKSYFDVYKSFYYVAEMLQPQLYDANIELNISSLDKIELFTYKSELMQVFMHILKKSIETFSYNKKNENHIFVNIEEDDNHISIKIYDNSFNEARKNHISKVFELNPSFREKLSTGSGLYVSKKIIEDKLNGTVCVSNHTYSYKSRNYKGILFNVTLPIDVKEKENIVYSFN
jgi:light-regulated signal transduction histidine kinase (bacteriophytochrome)